MKFLVLSDIHGELNNLEKLNNEFAECDAVLFSGDFVKFGATETGLPVLNTLIKKHDSLFCVIGNCDEPEFLNELENLDVSVENTLVYRDGLKFAGSGGTIKFTGTTPNEKTDEELVSELSLASQCGDYENLVLILHHPPVDTKCDIITSGIHVGSKEFRKFIEEKQPLLAVCGHIHESAGIDTIGKTTVMNPGALLEGKYGIIEIEKDNNNWKVTKAELKQI